MFIPRGTYMRERRRLHFFHNKGWRNNLLIAGISSFADAATTRNVADNTTKTILSNLAVYPLDATAAGAAIIAGLLNKLGAYLLSPYFEGNNEKASQISAIATGLICTTTAA